MIADIVVTTRNRLDYLQRTLQHIYTRTRAPYRLHVIDDASEAGNAEWLLGEFQAGRVHELLLRSERQGQMGNYNVATWLAYSDPVVFVDDDVLCPDVEPCWLTQGLEAMRDNKDLGLLSLHHPGAKVKPMGNNGIVTYCQSVGGTFQFARRKFLLDCVLPHHRYHFSAKPTEVRCKMAREKGWKIGILQSVYCYHIGEESAILPGTRYQGKFVPPKSWKTLEPSDERYK